MIMVMTPIKCICGLDFFVNTFYEKKKKNDEPLLQRKVEPVRWIVRDCHIFDG